MHEVDTPHVKLKHEVTKEKLPFSLSSQIVTYNFGSNEEPAIRGTACRDGFNLKTAHHAGFSIGRVSPQSICNSLTRKKLPEN